MAAAAAYAPNFAQHALTHFNLEMPESLVTMSRMEQAHSASILLAQSSMRSQDAETTAKITKVVVLLREYKHELTTTGDADEESYRDKLMVTFMPEDILDVVLQTLGGVESPPKRLKTA